MDNKMHLVIMPALNEEATIGEVIDGIRLCIPNADILVINDGSTDRTADIAREKGVVVIDLPFNLGYGAALQTGFRFANKEGYAFVVTIDADGQHVPSSIDSLLAVMKREGADVVIGSRFFGGQYRPGALKKIGIWLFSLVARWYTGINITDPTSGFQLLTGEVCSYLAEGDNYPLDYPDANIIMSLHKKKFKVVEAPVVMVNNPHKKSMHSGLRPLLYITKMVLAIVMVVLRREET